MEVKVNKIRNWFLTINEGAECYQEVPQILEKYENAEFSYILHDKDNEEQPHYHICILFKNARTFECMQRTFKGAHIEVMESKYKCFRYLLHLDDADKYQYPLDEVHQLGNNVEYYSTHDEYIKLDTESVLENIKNGVIRDIYDAVKLFGIKQCNMYRNIITELIDKVKDKEYIDEVEVFRLRDTINTNYEHIENLSIKLQEERLLNAELEKTITDLLKQRNQMLRQVQAYEEYLNSKGVFINE